MHLFIKGKLEVNNTLSGKIKNKVIELMHLQLPCIDNHDSLFVLRYIMRFQNLIFLLFQILFYHIFAMLIKSYDSIHESQSTKQVLLIHGTIYDLTTLSCP